MGRAYAKCKRNDHHHRPEPGAGKRHRHRNSERSAPKDTVIAKGTDNRTHAHTQQKDTGTAIGTETGNVIR